MSTDNGPLYPPGVAPKRFDKWAPLLEFFEPTPADASPHGKVFSLQVQVNDASPLAEITVIKPGAPGVTVGTIDLAKGRLTARRHPATDGVSRGSND